MALVLTLRLVGLHLSTPQNVHRRGLRGARGAHRPHRPRAQHGADRLRPADQERPRGGRRVSVSSS